jgi:hypothetical protein
MMGGRCPEGCIVDPGNASLEETSWGFRRMVAPYEGGRAQKRL